MARPRGYDRPHDITDELCWTRIECEGGEMHRIHLDAKGHLVLDEHPHLAEEIAYASYAGEMRRTARTGAGATGHAHNCHLALKMYRARNAQWFGKHGSQFGPLIMAQGRFSSARRRRRVRAFNTNRRDRDPSGHHPNDSTISTASLHDWCDPDERAIVYADCAIRRTTYTVPLAPGHERRYNEFNVTIGGTIDTWVMGAVTSYRSDADEESQRLLLNAHCAGDWYESVYRSGLAVVPDTNGVQCFVVQTLGTDRHSGGTRVRAGRPHDTGEVMSDEGIVKTGVLHWR